MKYLSWEWGTQGPHQVGIRGDGELAAPTLAKRGKAQWGLKSSKVETRDWELGSKRGVAVSFYPLLLSNALCPMSNYQYLTPSTQSLELRYFLLHYIFLIFLKSTKQMHFRYLIRFWY